MKKSKKEVQPNWHPNFRIQSELPDIKPIRTGFIINSFAVVLCLGLALMVMQQELKRMSLNRTIADLRATVSANESSNREALQQSREFVEEVRKLQELEAFYEAPVSGYRFLLFLAEIRSENLVYDSVTLQESIRMDRRNEVTTFRVQIGGKSRDLLTLGEFKDYLENLPFVVANGGVVNETIYPRDENTGSFPFSIVVDFELDGK